MKGWKTPSKTVQLSVISLILLVVMVLLRGDRFLRPANIDSMLVQLAEPGLFALCISLAYLSRGIDLSIVSVANLVGIVNGIILRNVSADSPESTVTQTLLLCVILGLAIGAACGLINGFLIAKVGIFPILVTLGTQNLFMGISMILTQGRAEGNFPQQLLDFGNASILKFGEFKGIPAVTVIVLIIFVLICLLVHKTPFGLKLQWFGSNSRVTYFSGINNVSIIFKTYVISGIIAGIAGLIIMARTNSAKADYGTTYVFQALLTCVLAGISPLGGRGKVYNVLLSLIALQILSTGFNMMRISPLIRDSLFGFLLIFSIMLDYAIERRQQARLNRIALRLQNVKTNAGGSI